MTDPAPQLVQLRSRKREVRAHTISIKRLTKTELEHGRQLYPEEHYWRPKTRGECEQMMRPCPYVSCRHHLYLDVDLARGSIKLNFPDLEPDEMYETCALDVAELGGVTLEHAAQLMNLTRERFRQLENDAIGKLPAEAVAQFKQAVEP